MFLNFHLKEKSSKRFSRHSVKIHQLGSWAEEKTKRRSKRDKQNKQGDGTRRSSPRRADPDPEECSGAGEHEEEEESGEAQFSTLPLHS
jgi:hypothetical protein